MFFTSLNHLALELLACSIRNNIPENDRDRPPFTKLRRYKLQVSHFSLDPPINA
jgi:hypothetical protein